MTAYPCMVCPICVVAVGSPLHSRILPGLFPSLRFLPMSLTFSFISRIAKQKKRKMTGHQKKSVSFNNNNQYHPSLCRDEYSDREFAESWYNLSEMKTIKEDCKRTAAMMRGASSVGPHVCARGLEGRTFSGHQQKKQNKACAYMAVEDEIERQRKLGISDPQALADEYMIYTRHCAAAARELGNVDHLEAVKAQYVFPLPRRVQNDPFFKRQFTKSISIAKVGPYGPFCPAA